MKRILVLDSSEEYAAKLAHAIQARGDYEALVAATLREACLLVAQNPPDLAFIPLYDAETVIRALHSLQPELPLVMLLPNGDASLPQAFQGALQAALAKADLPLMLPALFEEIFEETAPTVQVPPVAEMEKDREIPAAETSRTLSQVLEQFAEQERVVAALVSDGDELLAYAGELEAEQVQDIAVRVSETWRQTNSALIQFIHLPDRSSDLLLFTREVRGELLLTLAALPEIEVGDLRGRADSLISRLSPLLSGQPPAPRPPTVVNTRPMARPEQLAKGSSYALLWRPRRPLPGVLQIALRRALERIADANECALRHLLVEADLVHIVVSCPAQKSSAWAAHLFKQGAQEEIQQQFGVPAQLWEKGYYAAESDSPLSQAELNLFLGTQAQA